MGALGEPARVPLRTGAVVATLVGALAFASTALGGEPSAADKDTSRNLFVEGMRLLGTGDFKGGERACGAAYALVHAPTSALCWARALEGVGQLVEARDVFLDAVRFPVEAQEPPVFAQARAAARAEADSVEKRIPSVTLVVAGPDPSASLHLTIDGAEVPPEAARLRRMANPGRHAIKVAAPGFESSAVDFELREGEERQAEVTLRPATRGSSALVAAPPLALVAGAVGVVGLGVGIATGLGGASKHSALVSECQPNGSCPTTAQGDLDSFHSLRTVSTVAYVVGALGVAAGAVLWLTARPEPAASARTGLWFTPASVGVVRTF